MISRREFLASSAGLLATPASMALIARHHRPNTPPVPAAIAGLGYTLVLDEEFSTFSYNNNGSIVDSFTWQRPFNGANDGSASIDANGILHLVYTAGVTTKPIEVATRKSTDNFAGSFINGYFEARMTQPTGLGSTYPQWWLASTEDAWGRDCTTTPYGSPQLNPEIDIVEGGLEQGGFGTSGIQQFSTTTHSNTGAGCSVTDTQQAHFFTATSYLDTFHTYGMLWTASNISYYVDDVLIQTDTTPASMNAPMYVIMGNGGKHSGFTGAAITSDVQFDWVRVWQNPPKSS